MSLPEAPDARRLFFALWPDDDLRQAIHRGMGRWGRWRGRPVDPDNFHITLAFLGSVSAQTQHCLEGMADGVRGRPFELSMDHLGHWARPRVIWLGASSQPPALLELVSGINQGIRGCGLTPELRPYQAHLTLMRKAACGPVHQPIPSLRWPVSDFVLVASDTRSEGVIYHVLRRWPLQNTSDDIQG